MAFTVERVIQIDHAHMLESHFGFCQHGHGHRAVITAKATGPLQTEGSSNNMVIDFSLLKKAMMERIHKALDHGFAVSITDPRLELVKQMNPADKILITDGPPTAELLARWAFHEIEHYLDEAVSDVKLIEIAWAETPNNVARYYGE